MLIIYSHSACDAQQPESFHLATITPSYFVTYVVTLQNDCFTHYILSITATDSRLAMQLSNVQNNLDIFDD